MRTIEPVPAGSAPDSRVMPLRREWTAAFVVGELAGFLAPAVVGSVAGAAHAPDGVLIASLTVAGTVEGAALGGAQAWVLRRHAPGVDGRAWIIATAAAAGFAWFVGMGGGALMGAAVVPVPVALVILVPAWLLGLAGMGAAQWLVLRRAVPRSGRWIPVTAGAWLLGVMIPVAALSLVPNAWPMWMHAVAGVLGAVAMGVTVGALTGRTLARLLARRWPDRSLQDPQERPAELLHPLR